jgi:hypothetical protein
MFDTVITTKNVEHGFDLSKNVDYGFNLSKKFDQGFDLSDGLTVLVEQGLYNGSSKLRLSPECLTMAALNCGYLQND